MLLMMPLLYGWAAAQACPGPREVSQVVLSRTGHLLVAAIDDGACSELVGLDPLAGRLLWRSPGFASTRVLTLSRDDRMLGVAYGGQDSGTEHGLDVLTADTGRRVAALASDSARHFFPIGQEVSSLSFSPDDQTVYATLKLGFAGWNGRTGKVGFFLDYPGPAASGPNDPSASLDVSPDGKTLALASSGAVYLLLLPHDAEPEQTRTLPGKVPQSVTFSPDGKYLAAVTGERQTDTEVWNAASGHRVTTLHDCGRQFAWYVDSRSVACVAGNNAELHGLASQAAPLVSTPLPPRGQLLAGAGHIVLWPVVRDGQWSEPAKPYSFTLAPLGSGQKVAVQLPERATRP